MRDVVPTSGVLLDNAEEPLEFGFDILGWMPSSIPLGSLL